MPRRTNFHLLRPKKGIPATIMAKFQYKGARVEISTDEQCKPEHWDKILRRVADRFTDYSTDYVEVNKVLKELDDFIISTFHDASRKHELLQLTPDRFKKLIRGHLDGVDYSEQMTIADFYRHYLEKAATRPYKPLTKSTLKNYQADLTYFESFSNSLPHHPILPEGSLKLMEMYRDYLFSLPQDLAESTVYKLLKRFKALYRSAGKEGLVQGMKVSAVDVSKDLGVSQKPATKIALYLPEIKYLCDYDLSKNPAIGQTRDLFVFAALTGGLRYENWQDINLKNIHDTAKGKEFRAYTRKGDPKLIIAPFHELSYKIAERLNYQFPESISNQGANQNLKEMCRIVGFVEMVTIETRKGSGLLIEQKPKYELVTCHTARRTYATILHDAGVPMPRIVELMTHTDPATTKRYIKEDQARKSARLSALPFFNK
jgi:site-specific recombinase XerD